MPVANILVPYLDRGEIWTLLGRIGLPASSAWTERLVLGTSDSPVNVFAHIDGDPIVLARALSAESGGFCFVRTGELGAEVFMAGHRIPGEPEVWMRCRAKLAGIDSCEGALDVGGSAYPAAVFQMEPAHLTRAAFENIAPAPFMDAVKEAKREGLAIDGWRWLPRVAPCGGIPFVILERGSPCDPAFLGSLARRIERYGAAMELTPSDGTSSWWFEPDGTEEPDRWLGAVDAVSAWRDLAVTMGDYGGVFRWPPREAGRSLDSSVPTW